MANKLFQIYRNFNFSSNLVLLTIRHVSRFPEFTKPLNKSKKPQDTSLRIRSRIKSLSKESPPEFEQNDLLCQTFSTSEQYHLFGLRDTMNTFENYTIATLPKDARDVLHVCTKNQDEAGIYKGEIFFFRYLGAVVFWNIDKEEVEKIRTIMKRFEGQLCYEEKDIEEESEEIPYSYTKGETSFLRGRILLNEDASAEEKALEKFAFSNAMALAVKLGMWESELEKYIDSLAWVPDVLSKGLKLEMSREGILEKTGELIALRYKINLYSDLLLTPDFYWDRETLGRLYESMCLYMDVKRRTKVMNEKMNHCSELADLLRSHLSERHSNRLEWGVIALVAMEVFFETIHLVETHWPTG